MKILPIVLGVAIIALLAALILIPGKDALEPAPNSTSTGNNTGGVGNSTTTVPEEGGGGTSTSTLYGYVTQKGKTVNAYLAANQKIESPFRLTGNVPGGWAFEASFPVKLTDANGKVLWQGPAAVPNWMNAGQNWFGVTISFTKPTTATGFLVLANDNPSGLPENADQVRIPVRF